MLENLEPSDSYAVTHFPVNALGMTTKFFANYKSAPAYEDGIPKNKRGVQKGPVAAAAYAQERKNLTERVEIFLKMKIGTVTQIYKIIFKKSTQMIISDGSNHIQYLLILSQFIQSPKSTI